MKIEERVLGEYTGSGLRRRQIALIYVRYIALSLFLIALLCFIDNFLFGFRQKRGDFLIPFAAALIFGFLLAKNAVLKKTLEKNYRELLAFRLTLRKFKSEHQELKKRASHDFLTGIFNRYIINEFLEHEIIRVRRYGHTLCVMLIDIDHFKRINDLNGHIMGDEVLVRFVDLIKKNIRASDLFGRLGGDEFIIILPESSLDYAINLAEKLRLLVEEYDFGEVGRVTCSVGLTQLRENESIVDVIKRSDDALYEAKQKGRNCVVIK